MMTNPFILDEKLPRPDKDQAAYRNAPDDALKAVQAEWDASRKVFQDRDKFVADNRKIEFDRQATVQAERDRIATERATEAQATIDGDLKRRWQSVNPTGTDEQFQAALPVLREDRTRRLVNQSQTDDDRAKRSQAALARAF